MTTIKDVAKIAGVSITTVSATLNNSAPVSEKLKARVWDAVKLAGYQADPVARNLRMGVSTTIGLIVPDIATPWAAHLAKATQSALSKIGYNMLFASNEDDPDREFREIELFTAHRVAGLLIAPTSHGENYAANLQERIRVPTVLIDRVLPNVPYDAVTDDNHLGGHLITSYLIKLGHRRIAFLAGRPGISPSDERLEGFLQTLQEAGISAHDELVRRPVYRREHAFATVQQLMSLPEPPTAIVTINIAQLLGTMAGLANLGINVPQDVSVISFDGFHPADGWQPSITSLSQDIDAIGAKAGEFVLERINGEGPKRPRTVRIAPTLQIRTSSRQI